MRRLGPLLLAVAFLSAAGVRADDAPVRIGDADVLVLRAPLAGRTAAERAATAGRVLTESLRDPTCDPESFEISEPEPGLFRISLCGRNVVSVAAADAEAEGAETRAIAERWHASLREAWTAEKTRLYSRKLLEAAILGVLYPLLFLVLIVLTRLLVKRIARWVEGLGGAKGLRIGPVLLTAEEGDRGLLSHLVGLLGWGAYLFLGWVFLIAFFDRFPGTARWARRMLGLLRDLGVAVGSTFVGLIPRLLALLLLIVIARVVLRSVGHLFEQVRAKKFRLDPILTPDTAGPAEITARVVMLGLFVFAASLLVPGEAGTALLVAFALAGLAMALGARSLVENFLAGLVILYGRPFRTGQAVRLGETEGVVEHKGFLHLHLRLRDDRIALVPNRRVVLEDLRVVDAERALRFRVLLRPLRDDCAPEGLFRHAAAEAGLRRDDGRVSLAGVREGVLDFSVTWPLPSSADPAESRDRFFRSILARGKGLGVEVVSARDAAEER